ncbi:hypothetical protein BW247_14795 [Acidihalobacter ferrooxydans]|uniref:Autotransporter domain-containing protein n=2 Tax=Acidihalobacter ferrooxydans TaxID=1765967 RepID=A0A1P8UK47_9GAMM|nr:hypothetical protein BW247_14795 [Acidihalobacter ferrooxydans]
MRTGLLALSTLLAPFVAHAADFSKTYFFGDSLTDAGSFGSQFTINGLPDSAVWSQDLAHMLGTQAGPYGLYNPAASTPTLIKPLGGTDYAQGGARVTGTPGVGIPAAEPLSGQLQTFLLAHPQADPNALYAFWGGANDVFYQTTAVSQNHVTSSTALATIGAAAQSEVGLMAQLHAAGARYLMVLNLPDIGSTPETIISGIKAAGAAYSIGSAKIGQAVADAASTLRDTSATSAQATQVQAAAIARAASDMGLTPAQVSASVGQVKQAFSGFSQAFNLTLASSLSQSGFQVVALNIQGLFAEVLADPSRFGFTNVTGYACTTSSSFTCNAQVSGDVSTTQKYFFADSVHPTPAAHRILADYAYSVLNAPQLIGMLPLTMLSVQQSAAQQSMQGLAGPLAVQNGPLGVYVSASAAPTHVASGVNNPGYESTPSGVTLGLRLTAGAQLRLLLQLGAYSGTSDFGAGMGGFDLQSTQLGVYARWEQGPWSLTGGASAGLQSYTDVHRNVRLGPTVDVESGRTSGYSDAVGLTGGYAFALGSWRMQPTLGLRYRNVFVDSYAENGSSASAMQFGTQKVKQLTASAGWSVTRSFETRYGLLEPRLGLGLHKEWLSQSRDVSASLTSMPGSFALPVYAPGNRWGTVAVGLGDNLGAAGRVDLALSSQVGRPGYQQTTVSLAYSRAF